MASSKSESDKRRGLNRELYNALLGGEETKVFDLCKQIPDVLLHRVTIHRDTILHMATYSKQNELVLNLLKKVPDSDSNKLTMTNDLGHTILHEAAISNRLRPAAMEMLRKAPTLLNMCNKHGETALFRAAYYGQLEMFKFLDDQVVGGGGGEEECKRLYTNDDGTTILHVSIIAEHFDVALHIAKKYKFLVNDEDKDGMTALQLLSCNQSAFKKGRKQGFLLRLLNACVSAEDTTHATEEGYLWFKIPLLEAIREEKRKYESAVSLAKILIEKDTSWEDTESSFNQSRARTHPYSKSDPQSQVVGEELQTTPNGQETKNRKIPEIPLILATKKGILEIVEETLKVFPQAVEHIDDDGRNILHVAIKYRQIHIFDYVERLEFPIKRLMAKINNDGNSVLHMVGIREVEDDGSGDIRSPALLLQENLLLFERVKKISKAHFTEHINNKGKTAWKLFADSNANLRTEAKEWLKQTAEHCSIVAVLIATVAFAAAYTVPGGPNQNTGYPILEKQSFFVIFTLTDVLSLTFSLNSVITFLSILTSPFRLHDFKQSLPQKLMLGVTLLILSVSMMMLAFAATVILLIRNKQEWTRIALYLVAFLPVSIFALSYLPLYTALMKTFKYSLKKMAEAFPQPAVLSSKSLVVKSFQSGKTESPNPTTTNSKRPSTPQTTRSPV